MKTIGIIIPVFGALSTLGGIIGTISGRDTNLAGLSFVILGEYLIHRAKERRS